MLQIWSSLSRMASWAPFSIIYFSFCKTSYFIHIFSDFVQFLLNFLVKSLNRYRYGKKVL